MKGGESWGKGKREQSDGQIVEKKVDEEKMKDCDKRDGEAYY